MKKSISILFVLHFIIQISFAQYPGYGMGSSSGWESNSMFGASQVILKSGELAPLKLQRNIRVVYDYSKMKVGQYNSEEEYINATVKQYEQRKAGGGEEWKNQWRSLRREKFEPAFEKAFNKKTNKVGSLISDTTSNSKFTLVVRTMFIDPASYGGPSRANFEFEFIESANPSVKIAELYVNNVMGDNGVAWSTGSFIAKSFTEAGYMTGAFIVKKIKK